MFSLLQASRFVAALMVVLDHATVTIGDASYYPGYEMLGGLFGAGRYGVDFFFVLSGFIICYAHWHDVSPQAAERPQRLARFLRRRFVRIYPTYHVVLLLVLVPLYVSSTRFSEDIRSPWYLFKIFTLLQGNGNVLTSAWTLTHEVVFYVLFALAIWRRNLGVALLAGWFVLSGLSFVLTMPFRNFINPEHLGFLVGMAGCYLVRTARIPAPHALLAAGLAGFTACYVLAGYFGEAGDINGILADPRSRGPLLPLVFSSLLIIVGLVEIERSTGVRAPAPLRYLGDASYSLYLLHFPVLVVIVKLFHFLHLERHVPLWVLWCGCAIATTVISVVFHAVVEKPLLSWVNRAIGKSEAERETAPAGIRGTTRPQPVLAAEDA
jgi:peptidoglycan/LPS O-acetylase OafA/YrhL